MKMHIAGAILGLAFATAAAHAQDIIVIPAQAGDVNEQRTSIPDVCADRDVNCVLNDGPSREAVVGASESAAPGTPGMGAPGGTTGGTGMGAFSGSTSGSGAGGF